MRLFHHQGRVRKGRHKEHGLLLRRMFYSKFDDSTLLQHVKGHPERRLPKGQRWQELTGCDAGIYLADKIADANMSEDARYVWENDGSIQYPMITIDTVDILKLFASIDLWSIVDEEGIPILESPVARIQARRFARYLQRRDGARAEKLWTTYVPTAPAAAFPHERLYHRRAKVTKVVFNWYLREEQRSEAVDVGTGETVVEDRVVIHKLGSNLEGALPMVPPQIGQACLLCGGDMFRDTERHLYVNCSHVNIGAIRLEAEETVRSYVAATPEGPVKSVSARLCTLLFDEAVRHRTWKGIMTPAQVKWISDGMDRGVLSDRSTLHAIGKEVKRCLHVAGAALLAIRKAAWKAGGPVVVKQKWKAFSVKQRVDEGNKSGSILALLGVMSPKEAACWELDRRKRRVSKQQSVGKEKLHVPESSMISKQWDVH